MRNVVLRQVFGHESVCAAVQAVEGQQMIPRRKNCQERGGNRGHAARRHQRIFRTLERGDLFVQHEVIRIVVEPNITNVVIVRLAVVVIGARLEDRHDHGAVNSRPRLAGVNEFGFDRAFLVVHVNLRSSPTNFVRLHSYVPRSEYTSRISCPQITAALPAMPNRRLYVVTGME